MTSSPSGALQEGGETDAPPLADEGTDGGTDSAMITRGIFERETTRREGKRRSGTLVNFLRMD